MADQAIILCVGGPMDGRRVEFRGLVWEHRTPVSRLVEVGGGWPSAMPVAEILRGPSYRLEELRTTRSYGWREAFRFYLADGVDWDDVIGLLMAGYRPSEARGPG